MINHRVECEDPGCGRVWRENCADCARETAAAHRRRTGHRVGLVITQAQTWQEVREMTGMAHRMLMLRGRRKGW